MGLKNKKKIIAIILIVVIVIISGITYGYWNKEYIGKENTNNFNCLNITKVSETSEITLNNAYPITDEEGINDKNNMYEVQIKNTCNLMVQYNVIANVINSSNLEESHVKIGSKKTTEEEYAINLLSNYEETTPRVEEVKKARVIKRGYLKKDETTTISIKEWMDYETTKEEGENKKFISKITIEGINGENTLGGKILANNKVIEKEPDFSKGEPLGEDCSQVITKDKTVSLLSSTNYYIGESFEYNGTDNGQYTIKNNDIKVDNYTTNNFTDNDIGKYICMGRSNPCTTMYKIKRISEDKTRIIKADEYTSTCKSETQGSGLYKAEDDQGESYYFRGNIENNYVKFADMLWRIVRINGDGSTRVILKESIGTSAFNTNIGDRKYGGFTYDNSIPCTKNNPCKSTFDGIHFRNENGGTNSDIKNILEQWYSEKLKDYDNYIAYSSFCNDVLYSSTLGADERYPSFYFYLKKAKISCSDPKDKNGKLKTYGGVYKLKIGLLTLQEQNLGGLVLDNIRKDVLHTNYLCSNLTWYTMSPSYSNDEYIYYYKGHWGFSLYNRGDYEENIFPIINLEPYVQVTGQGTKEDPYQVIES